MNKVMKKMFFTGDRKYWLRHALMLLCTVVGYASTSLAQSWSFVGTAGFSTGIANFQRMAFSHSGVPYVIYADNNSGLYQAAVKKYNGSAWVSVGVPFISPGQATYTDIAFDAADTPYIVYMDYANGQKATVMKFDGSSWITVGGAGFTPGAADYFSLKFDAAGVLYVAYDDYANSNRASVMKYNGSSWVNVGAAGFSAGDALWISLDIDATGNLYVGFEDYDNGQKATVMKYNGSAWATVGSGGISVGGTAHEAVAIGPGGTPYIAFKDDGLAGKAVVKKYNGSSWESVGPLGISAGIGSWLSLAVDATGVPYLAYSDGAAGGATVKKFDGISWASVGGEGLITAGTWFKSLAFDPVGVPYLAFSDDVSGFKTTVMKFNSPITGTTSICLGGTTTLSDTATGGVWSSDNVSVATVDAAGVVSGLTVGSALISYTTAGGSDTLRVTVFPPASAGTISGSATVCQSATTTLTSTITGGVWSSSNVAVTTVNDAGAVTGVSPGTAIISYAVTNCGTAYATQVITVNPSPNAGTITGTATVCPTATTTLASTGDAGGTWASSIPSRGTVASSSGVVTGISAGTTTISYSATNSCGTATATTVVTVNPLPNAGTITGTATVCSTSTTTLNDILIGGVWSSSTSAVGTVSTSGVVTGLSGGTTTISYSRTNSCGTAVATMIVTVNPLPNGGTITGTPTVCPTATTSLSSTGDAGGTWFSSSANATIGATTGVVTGVTAGTSTITYSVSNGCGTTTVTRVVTVNALPNAGTIMGSPVCPSASTTLTNPTGDAGGVWSSVTTSVATINASSGLLNGVSAGTSVISYTVTNVCGTAATSMVFTVNPLPSAGTITGTATVCVTSTITLTDGAGGGVWSSSTPAKGTVNASGVVAGIASGTTTISYSVTNGCGTAVATKVVTVNPLPNAGIITGTATVCPTATTTLSSTGDAGGAWTSVSSNATVGASSGVVTGVTAGTSTISYSVTNSCGVAAVTRIATVNALPNAGFIVGSSTCPSGTITLTSPTGDIGGVWTSGTTSVATINSSSGFVNGVSFGTTVISYAVTNVCGTAATSIVFTVNASPNAGSITGPATVCVAATITLTDGVSGGIWSSSTPARGTVNASGVVTGISAGTTTISYSITNSCGTAVATKVVTVNPLPNAGTITGPGSVCVGASITLLDGAPGGVWSSLATTVATVDPFGAVTGISAGTSTISYVVTNSCGTATATKVVTVNPLPSAISGAASVCQAASTMLTNPDFGGAWSASNTNVSVVPSTGATTGVASGTVTITYTLPTGCTASMPFTVNALPSVFSVTGGGSYCAGGVGLHIGVSGSNSGIQYQLYNGTTPVGSPLTGTGPAVDFGLITAAGTYTVEATNSATSCTAGMAGSALVTINSYVVPSVSMGSTPATMALCTGVPVTFTAIPVNGGTMPAFQWEVNGSSVGTSSSYAYVPSNGDIISVTLFPAGSVCVSPATAISADTLSVLSPGTPLMTIGAVPGGSICPGTAVTFSATATSFAGTSPLYRWIKNGVTVWYSPYYTYIPVNGDVVFCKLISDYACRLTDTAYSNTISVSVVTPTPAPTVTITGGTVVGIGATITLTANAIGGTTPLLYQWSVNSVLIPGTTNNVFMSSSLANGSIVACRVTNTDMCAYHSDKSVVVSVRDLGVGGGDGSLLKPTVYPNPNDGAFVLNVPSMFDEEASVIVSNILGVKIQELKVATNKEVGLKLDTPGIYIVTIFTSQGTQSIKVNVR
jgi:uncharacterized protein YjdB